MTIRVRAGGLRGYNGLVKQLGGDALRLTHDCGLTDGLLNDEDALIPYRQLIHLLEHTASELGIPDFGLRLAASQDIGILGPLAVAMQNSSTVAEALQCATAYLFVQSPALSMDIEELPNDTRLRIQIRLADMPHQGMCQAEDLSIGVAHGVVNMLAQNTYQLIRVELPHLPLCPESVYERYFGAPVTFGCRENALHVRTSTLSTSLTHRSEQLHRLAASYLDVQLPSADGCFSTQVETAVRRTLGTDSCNRASVARAMALHPRTLQRHLKREGTTFDAIRDRIRRTKAEYYLCNTSLPLSQVAGIVGYSEQAILARSCRRWFNSTPRKLRAASQPDQVE